MLAHTRKISRLFFPTSKEKHFVFHGKTLLVKQYIRTGMTEQARFAVVVPKKFSKSAVERNTLKRRVNSVIEKHIGSFDQSKFGRHVIFPKKQASMIKITDIKNDIEELLHSK